MKVDIPVYVSPWITENGLTIFVDSESDLIGSKEFTLKEVIDIEYESHVIPSNGLHPDGVESMLGIAKMLEEAAEYARSLAGGEDGTPD